jgi:cellobiose epimerase
MKNLLLFILLIISFVYCSGQPGKDQVSPQKAVLSSLRAEVRKNLTENILPYWSDKMSDNVHGGFYGRIDGNDKIYPDAEKGGILNARILWTWSAAYRVLKDTAYLRMAKRARDYIYKYFIDPQYGGAYRSVKATGEPADTRKQVYTLSFFIYALSEYSRATGDADALKKAQDIYNCIEKYAADPVAGGYYEVFTRDWQRSRDRLIGEKNDSVEKTMNTHLHLLESYTSLYRIWPDKKLKERLKNLVLLFENKIIDNRTFHLVPFLDRNWVPASDSYSFGHDIECSWLLCESAVVLGDPAIISRIKQTSLKIAGAASEGLQVDGSMATEKDLKSGKMTSEKSWWEQAETIVGFLNAFELTANMKYLGDAMRCWKYTSTHFVDIKNGGWYSNVDATGVPGTNDKAGFWICPYHSSRMCLEVIERVPANDSSPSLKR